MFPDFVKAKKKAGIHLRRSWVEQIPKFAPLLLQVRRFAQHEGLTWDLEREDGTQEASTFKEFSAEIKMSREEMKRLDPIRIIELLNQVAETFARQQSQMMFEGIAEATKERTIHVGGELRPEHVMKAFQEKDVDFDPKTGEVSRHEQIVMSTELYKKLAPKLEAWDRDHDLRRRFDEIIANKREEWRAREARRRLVD